MRSHLTGMRRVRWGRVQKEWYEVHFEIEGVYSPDLAPAMVCTIPIPVLNYFRIEEFSLHDIFCGRAGFQHGLFKREICGPSTIRWDWIIPRSLDIRGELAGTERHIRSYFFQYDPAVAAGTEGGTLNPFTKKVLDSDIQALKLFASDL